MTEERALTAAQGPVERVTPAARRRRHPVTRFIRRHPTGAGGLFVILLLMALALLAPWVAPYDPVANDFGAMFRPPSIRHWGGTDAFGRDVLSRVVFGARTALVVGFGASLLGATIGAVIGVASAYFGGRTDLLVQRLVDVMLSFPLIIVALAIVSIIGTGTDKLIVAIALSFVPRVERVVRGSALGVRAMTYIEAAQAIGVGPWRIIFRHMTPNVMAPYLVMLTASLGQAILLEASLSFLGLGVSEPTPAWGLMLRGAAVDFATRAPWMAIFPGLAITITVLSFNVLGDALRDAMDPRLRT